MNPRYAAVFFFAFAAGFFSAQLTTPNPRPAEPIDPVSSIRVIRCDNPAVGSAEFTPYRSIVNGQGLDLAPPPKGESEVWRIDLDNGRMVLFTTRKSLD